jgi:cardiolipin synthase
MIVGAILISWQLGKPVRIAPVFISKVNTAAQIAFAALMLGTKAFGFNPGFFQEGAALIVAALTLASGGAYLGPWIKHMGL